MSVIYTNKNAGIYANDRQFRVATVTLTTDGSGDATQSVEIYGYVLKVITNPGAAAPTDNWDLTVIDEDGVDILAGDGANRDTSNSEQLLFTSPLPVSGDYTVTVANGGASKDVVIKLWLGE